MSSSTWQEHFKERLSGLEPPREGSFLAAALEDKRFSEEEYLQWATARFLLPVLDGRFFSEIQPDSSLLEKHALPWSATLIPVAEWDGTLIVAGLEKPEAFPAHAVFVLAPPSGTGLWWESLSSAAAPLDPVMDTPEGMIATDAPAGLSFAGITLQKADAPTAAAAENPAPTGAELKPLPSLEKLAEAPAEKPVAASVAAKTAALAKESAPGKRDESLVTSVTAIKPPSKATPVALDGPFDVHVNPTNETHVLSPLAASHKTFLEEIRASLKAMNELFPKSMFLTLNEPGTALLPLVWSASFGKPQNPSRFPVTAASPFRVAIATEKPYHGYVVANDVSEMFARIWNESKTPEHLTIVPVFFKNRLVGAMLGAGPATCATLSILRGTEKITDDLTRRLGGAAATEEAA